MRGCYRVLAVLTAVSLLMLTPGCGAEAQPSQEEGTAVNLYYAARNLESLEVEDTVLPETRSLNVVSLWDFFEIYFAGPESEDLMSPFPGGTRVVDASLGESSITIQMSGEFFTLAGIEMSLASCCLAKTVCEYLELEAVVLTDETESIRMEVQPGQFVLSNVLEGEADQSFNIYFSDSDHRYLISETRAATLSENESQMAYVMRRLLEGPESSQLRPVIPEGTEILEISEADGICTVNFSREFYDNRPEDDYGAYMTVYGITNTLTGLSGMDAVQFLVEGEPVERYGCFPLLKPVLKNTDCIGPVRMTSGEIDADLYVRSMDTGVSFAFPCRVKQTISEPMAQAVVTKLLSYEPPQGFRNPVPYGTELLSISISGSTCYVDLSGKFVPAEDSQETEREAVWALVMTLTALDNVSYVALTIDGESSGLSYVDITEPLTRRTVASYGI